jgi:hypothetical protein
MDRIVSIRAVSSSILNSGNDRDVIGMPGDGGFLLCQQFHRHRGADYFAPNASDRRPSSLALAQLFPSAKAAVAAGQFISVITSARGGEANDAPIPGAPTNNHQVWPFTPDIQ